MNPGIYVIIGFGENLYGEKSLGSISKIIRSFGKNATEESERKEYQRRMQNCAKIEQR